MLGFISNSPAKIWRALRSMYVCAKYVCLRSSSCPSVRMFVVVGWRKNVGSTRRSCIFNKVKKKKLAMTGTPFYIYIFYLSLKATRLNTPTLL